MVIALKFGVCFIPSIMGGQRLYESSYSAKDKLKIDFHRYSVGKFDADNLGIIPSSFCEFMEKAEMFTVKLSALEYQKKTIRNYEVFY